MDNLGRVLIVDDREENLLLLEAILEPEGFEVLKAKSGRECLELAEVENPDIIILDVLMPEMNGFQVCRILRSKYKFRFIPIIMVTALNRREDVIEGLEAGADDFISKPVDDDLLVAKVKSLVKLKKGRDEVEKMRSELSSMIVHDLKSPVHSILSCCELIREEANREKILKYVSLIEKSGRKLNGLILRFLEVSRIESGNLNLNFENRNIIEVLKSAISQVDSISREKDVKINLKLNGENEKIYLNIDVEKMEEAFLNLLENGLKYVPRGGKIDVIVNRGEKKVVIKFRDNGPGISDEIAENIFEKYVKGRGSKGGSGLGLYIVKGIVNMHGGKIFLDREYKDGAQFVIELPIERDGNSS